MFYNEGNVGVFALATYIALATNIYDMYMMLMHIMFHDLTGFVRRCHDTAGIMKKSDF